MSPESSVIRFRHNAELSEVPNQLTLPISDMTHTQTLNVSYGKKVIMVLQLNYAD